MLATDAELIVDAGVDAVRSIDCGIGLVDNSNSPRGAGAGSTRPVEELAWCRGVRSDSVIGRICKEAICAAARCLVWLCPTRDANKSGICARFSPFFGCGFSTVLKVLSVGASTSLCVEDSRSSAICGCSAIGSDESPMATDSEEPARTTSSACTTATLVVDCAEWMTTEGCEGAADG